MRTIVLFLAFVFTGMTTSASAQTASDYTNQCDDGADDCRASLAQFKKWFPRAMRGDYQGQRNVAFCLSTGCDGAVTMRPLAGCAWRLLIVATGSKDVDQSDTLNMKRDCGKLDDIDRQAAAAQSARLIAKIGSR
ncbi:conserved hypothetical protein [Nitrobacter hamburgensis X14]|uniref:Uncharacterized protein n=1 Tax=Nitrobacter hamburgensis (strain DSM 10229 / NCIMB 13809 / X14) TaxID=323097 RepID=Q1QI96_NITHX|nr:hypothetical protein [Nitrobacter hamburgensis]ABE64051.1 conserved hypothetical protein [Nitrobacter hamburgensis X14]